MGADPFTAARYAAMVGKLYCAYVACTCVSRMACVLNTNLSECDPRSPAIGAIHGLIDDARGWAIRGRCCSRVQGLRMDWVDGQRLYVRAGDAAIGTGPGCAAIRALEDAQIPCGGVERAGGGWVHHHRLHERERQIVDGRPGGPAIAALPQRTRTRRALQGMQQREIHRRRAPRHLLIECDP